MLTRQTIAQHLSDYLNHRISLAVLVDWAENAIMKGGQRENMKRLLCRYSVELLHLM